MTRNRSPLGATTRFIFSLLFVPLGILSAQKQNRPSHETPKESADIRSLTKNVIKAVVSITVYDKNGVAIGQGSGFFVDSAGKLVTNHHVLKDAASVIAKSPNGAFYAVEGILDVDKQYDLAVLKISVRDTPFLLLGDSDLVEVGEKVLAIGSPLGLEATVSEGLISGIRDVGTSRVFQTTASVSPGSSGGALLTGRGEVIGVTSFELTGGQNLNFAIPSNYIRPLLKSNSVTPFANTDEVAQESPPRKVKPNEVPALPRRWINIDGGSLFEVWIDGEYLYAQGHSSNSGLSGSYEVDVICETKRQADRWTGKCRYRLHFVLLAPMRERWCKFELDETITSLSASRIEGESQDTDDPSSPTDCPRPSNRRKTFTLIPKK